MTEHLGQNPTVSAGKAGWLATYRMVSLCMAILFAGVGVIFLSLPDAVLRFFNGISLATGFDASPVEGRDFYVILAVGYMYVVAVLAWFMYREPKNRALSLILVNAKLASSILSLIFFFGVSQALIFLANGVVDGLIGAGVFLMYWQQRRAG